MKNKIAIASAFLAAASFSTAEIVINDFLSFEGFVDMSYSHYDGNVDIDPGVLDQDESDNSFGLNQVEISWLFDFDPVTAQIDLQYLGNSATTTGTDVEQAFVTYHFDGDHEGSAITAGLYASMLGFEAFEPTGLYQSSFAYGLPNIAGDLLPFIAQDDIDAVSATMFPLPGYAQGVKYTHEDDNSFFGISLQDGVGNYSGRLGGDTGAFDGTASDGGGYGVEIAYAYDFDNGFAAFAGFAYETGDGLATTNIVTGDTESYVFNTYVTYETGAWLFAAELNYGETEWENLFGGPADLETESLSALIMANYAYSDVASVTGRISYLDYDAELSVAGAPQIEAEAFKYTLAHNHAFTDNLLLVTEVSYTDGDFDTNLGAVDGDFDELFAEVKLIFSF
ncbi:MAG: hypothetical protein ABS34_12755 [Opitutaceae bacterium BACL24 MAG-120322-bin51]|nr:MAG: hypothetical protein ABS34_12755 [Opitutaceae bacterium BACL24 MAG-120322-bin51]